MPSLGSFPSVIKLEVGHQCLVPDWGGRSCAVLVLPGAPKTPWRLCGTGFSDPPRPRQGRAKPPGSFALVSVFFVGSFLGAAARVQVPLQSSTCFLFGGLLALLVFQARLLLDPMGGRSRAVLVLPGAPKTPWRLCGTGFSGPPAHARGAQNPLAALHP